MCFIPDLDLSEIAHIRTLSNQAEIEAAFEDERKEIIASSDYLLTADS